MLIYVMWFCTSLCDEILHDIECTQLWSKIERESIGDASEGFNSSRTHSRANTSSEEPGREDLSVPD